MPHYRPCESKTVIGLKKIQGEICQGTSANMSCLTFPSFSLPSLCCWDNLSLRASKLAFSVTFYGFLANSEKPQ